MMLRRPLALGALVAASLVVAAAPYARMAETGTLVIRLVTDPAPPGVSWSYGGAGASFQLGLAASQRSITNLAAGPYRIAERSTDPNRPSTLTAVTCSDPSSDSKGDLATASATVSLAAGETVTCTFTHRALGPRSAASAAALARQFAPTLRLSLAEHYKPLAMREYVARSVLRTGLPPHGASAQPHPTLFSLPTTPTATYLDVGGAEPYLHASQYRTIEHQLEQASPRPTVYWRLAHQPSTGRIAIEYWFLYLYNDFVDRHEADWEGITVFLQTGTPLGITYSQHQGRAWTAWPAALPDDHPVIDVAAGSHANYPLPGRYRVKICWTLSGVRHCTTTTQRDDARGDGAPLTAATYDLQELDGTGYTGSWGSGNYVLGIGLTKDRVTDPRRRTDYSNPFAAVPPGA